MTVEFQLEGQKFIALNGGPIFKFTEAISFVVNCQTQAEVDKFWKQLSAGGKEVQCGLAQGQIRTVLADRAHGFWGVIEPAALHLFAAGGELLPELVHFGCVWQFTTNEMAFR